MRHLPIVTGGGRPKQVLMHWSNTGLGNLKGAINGTCRSCDAHHTDRYLAAYEWRFNRRFVLAKNLERLARAAVKTHPSLTATSQMSDRQRKRRGNQVMACSSNSPALLIGQRRLPAARSCSEKVDARQTSSDFSDTSPVLSSTENTLFIISPLSLTVVSFRSKFSSPAGTSISSKPPSTCRTQSGSGRPSACSTR